MKFFKGSSSRKNRRGSRHKSKNDGAKDGEKSVGSELSTKDQFDIVVPRSEGTWIAFENDSGTEISSITTDDRRYHGRVPGARYPYYGNGSSSYGSTWCCFSGNTVPTELSDNTLLSGKTKTRNTLSAEGGSSGNISSWTCCGGVLVSEPDNSRTRTQAAVATKTTSTKCEKELDCLFDSLSEDDEDNNKLPNRRKWRTTFLRKARSWRKKHQHHQKKNRGEAVKEPAIDAGSRESMTGSTSRSPHHHKYTDESARVFGENDRLY